MCSRGPTSALLEGIFVSNVIEKNQVVTFHYSLKDGEGNLLDESLGGDPLAYLHGHSNIIPGLESELVKKKAGDKLKVHVTPEKGYGSYDPEKRFLIERSQLPPVDVEVGMTLELHADDGESMMAAVVALDENVIEVDGNHPMAGKDLYFEVEIVEVRPASSEEIAHGHVHGPGGHHH